MVNIQPTPFNVLMNGRDIDIVQINSLEPCGSITVGFCGQFKWSNNKITSLDGDSYYDDMLVYAYEEVENDELNILIIYVYEW